MPVWGWLLVALGIYAAFVLALAIAGRRGAAAALARFVPDCAVLVARLARDERVPRRRRLGLVAVAAYLTVPIDLVPDFIPVAGQLDDAVLVALALRWAVRGAGPALIQELWPGPRESLAVVMRLACGQGAPGTVELPHGDPSDDRPDHDAPDGRVGDRGDGARVAQGRGRPGRGR